MRMMMQMSIPVEAGNDAAMHGTLGSTIQKFMADVKPEAAYFIANEQGERTGIFVFDMKDSSQIPALAEPLFMAFHARIKFMPVMNAEDLAKGLGALQK
jgi:hypothetical protein